MSNKVNKGYTDCQTGWICIQTAKDGKHWFRIDSISWSRKSSIDLFLKNGKMTWEECKEYGWVCKRIKIELTTLS